MLTANLTPAQIAEKFINNTNCPVFLTGKAGTGKTTFLKNIVKSTHKKTVVAAPTGIAAINAGGVTLHSLFQLPFGSFVPTDQFFSGDYGQKFNTPSSLFKEMKMGENKRKLINEMELLIIDEVSMLRADLLDAIDTVCKSIRKEPHLPFGGLQVLFIGDLLQLPPVVKDYEWRVLGDYYGSMYFFDAQVLQDKRPVFVELDKIYRQSDEEFIALLNELRDNSVTPELAQKLNKYYQPGFKTGKEEYIYLTTHNAKANSINQKELNKIVAYSETYKAKITGDFNEYTYPVDPKLELKQGAQVMFIKNDPTGEQKFFNGKIGKVKELDQESMTVEFSDGSPSVAVERYQWENTKFELNKDNNEIEEKVVGIFEQFPLRLAWAITIHKSQGLTFERAVIDLESVFAPGQMYVALSRLTSLNGLVLSSRMPMVGFGVDEALAAYFESQKNNNGLSSKWQEESANYVLSFARRAFDFREIVHSLGEHVSSYKADAKKSSKAEYVDWAKSLSQDFKPVMDVSLKFMHEIERMQMLKTEEIKDKLSKRTKKAKEYFEPYFTSFSERIEKQVGEVKVKKGVKLYVRELQDLEKVFFHQRQKIYKLGAMLKSFATDGEFSKDAADRVNNTLLVERAAKANLNKGAGNTRELSYQMYKEGKPLESIATERNLTVGTIEGHMAFYVKSGDLKVTDFISEDKLKNILEVVKAKDTTSMKVIRDSLGDSYTFGDIRFALTQV